MDTNKKAWTKPILIVIGRGTPEESVLDACKGLLATGPGGSGCNKSNGTGACSGQGRS